MDSGHQCKTKPSSPAPETEFTPLKDRQSALIGRLLARKGTSEHQGQPHAGLQYALDECIDLEEKLLESIRTISQLRSQLRDWETWGTVEIAVRNPNVDSYMKHWEGRALAAAKISREELLQSGETLRKLERFWTGLINYGGG